MKKILIICFLGFLSYLASAQAYNNEWINYSNTYYKFKVGVSGLYRITENTLTSLGLGNTPAEQFQLWRNGQQVPLYTSAATGVLAQNGYIEFWGKMNDGVPDGVLYFNPANQLSTDLSLETDTAAFFLTFSTTGNNARVTDAANNVAGNTLSPLPYFMYDYRVAFQLNINYGLPQNYGEYIYASTYDVGEFWATNDIHPGAPFGLNPGNLYLATAGPSASVQLGVAGNSFLGEDNYGHLRTVQAFINNTKVIDSVLQPVDAGVYHSGPIPLSVINSNANVTMSIADNNPYDPDNDDRVAANFLDLNYPRLFDFGGGSNFVFTLPATATGYYLQIKDFNQGGATPELYDLTYNQRYAANTSTPGVWAFVLPPGGSTRNLVLVSEDPSNINSVTSLTQRNFVNFSNATQQGDYLIVSNKVFFAGDSTAGQYRSYRSSISGGSYRAKVYDIDELVDQFAFGIKKDPLSIKNFLRFARHTFTIQPKFCFLIGKAVSYNEYRLNQNSPYADRLNLVPTFGWPASDNLLASDNLYPLPATPIGRLSAVYPTEVTEYLQKMETYEQQQANTVQTIANKAWMKTMIHIVGANSDPSLNEQLTAYETNYQNIISAPLYGANVYNFNTTTVSNAYNAAQSLTQLFSNGISVLNYFGHSAATTLDYNLNSPSQYPNPGKYPFFVVNGCNAGNIFDFDTTRLTQISSLSELYVIANGLGAIGFLASSSFGVANYLDTYNTGFYTSLSTATGYNQSVSTSINAGVAALLNNGGYQGDLTAILHAEENILHGDPALKINAFALPDFDVEAQSVSVNPTFISVADSNFNVKAYLYNIGQATSDSVSVMITRTYPDNTKSTIFSGRLSFSFIDSISLKVPILPTRDKGQNYVTVVINYDRKINEITYANDSITQSFFIYTNELTPVYPYNFAIVNKSNIKLVASTANAITPLAQYAMQIDTTTLFNSPSLYSTTVKSIGGEIEFNPGITFTDSTVYYWRTAPVPTSGAYHWDMSSFVYLPGSSYGFNQSHLYQHLQSTVSNIYIDSTSRKWNFVNTLTSFDLTNTVYNPNNVAQSSDVSFQIEINNQIVTQAACLGHSIIFNVCDPITLKPFYNQPVPSTISATSNYGGFMQSAAYCTNHEGTQYNFEFPYNTVQGRNNMAAFMAWVPAGYIVTARVIINAPYDSTTFAADWKSDPLVNNTNLYYSLISSGFAGLDQYSFPRAWVLMYEKNVTTFKPMYAFTKGANDVLDTIVNVSVPDSVGYITSPLFGPAKDWKNVVWNGYSLDTKAGDAPTVQVIGVSAAGTQTLLYTLTQSQQNFNISTVNATTYPYIMLRMRNADSINLTPYQLRHWMLLYDPVPEGALAPNLLYKLTDTVGAGQLDTVAVAFKNISDVAYPDSIQVQLTLYNAGNVANTIPTVKLKKLNPGDTAVVFAVINTASYTGLNNLYLYVNPNGVQPEQYLFNNFFYQNILVQPNNYKPTLDVTFDGVHLLNYDIASAHPHVIARLQSSSKYLLLTDTSELTVQLAYPDGTLRRFPYTSDTVRFTPATAGAAQNVAQVDFLPYLTEDGIYTLYISGKDASGNPAGNAAYSVSFTVYNKPMISNMFNYPNPFTTSTAFVFTITGSQVPQNIRIEILTITGKIVKEITESELGPLHVGNNITQYKWNGTDQYGQKLANGVYIFRVLTNLNGRSLDKFTPLDQNGNQINTSQYFNSSYGKMYLMR